MKAVILAAGAGKRFKALDLPKPLTRLANGKSILEMQIDALSSLIPRDDIIIIVGYKKEKVMEEFPDLLYVYNPNFANENTAKSLLRAAKKIDDDLLWINGDVVFHPKVLKAILDFNKTSMIVNRSPVGEEEIKYRTSSHGRILEVSKTVKKPQGEALGINLFLRKDLESFKNNLTKCSKMDYFEKAIELCIQQGTKVWSVPIDPLPCIEIDFPEDLKKANALLW